ncbi:double-stranded RNA-specific editase Adar-like [Haematobia irritans]|uniref:double-stranded RNA-specific editase Adar-like n=1 Tax=Haematobia irritans TaxID=7368 RepID=UPI003F4F9898
MTPVDNITNENFATKEPVIPDVDKGSKTSHTKNAVSILNELRPGLIYRLESQVGPSHAPFFTISLEIDGQKFLGQGCNKKFARNEAAKRALSSCEFTASSKTKRNINDVEMSYEADHQVNGKSSLKRPFEGSEYSQNPRKKFKTSNESVLHPKNPITLLNEIKPGLTYNLESQTGPSNSPNFVISIEIGGQKYVGQGRSKKIARSEAAAEALRKSNICKSLNLPIENLITNSKANTPINNTVAGNGNQKMPEKSPVSLLYERFSSDVNFHCSNTDGTLNNCTFKMTVTVNGSQFTGFGPSKKAAKNAAAKAALASLCNISYSPMTNIKKNIPITNGSNKFQSMELSQVHADIIGHLVLEKFEQIIKNNETYSRRKVIAGIVMTKDMNFNKAQVISVTTGTKCVSGEHMCINGTVLNDSHAEIVSRRCFVKFIYSQLELHLNPATASQSIFEKNLQNNGKYPYKLKSGIHFHLYINTAPCGDARIFSPHQKLTNIDNHPNRKARGQLRSKIESGEGTIPVKTSYGIQTWDGVLEGQRLRTMSCSDKIARWNVLGIQGSLLSTIIEPIYLYSIVLGSLLHPEHMYRAVCGRIETSLQTLPSHYRLNKPLFAQLTSSEPRNQAKAPNFGINWTVGDKEVEVVNSLTGRTILDDTPRLAKQVFFEKYAWLIRRLPGLTNRKLITVYSEAKFEAHDYQMAKLSLYNAFRSEDLGNWLKKPQEQDGFTLLE